MRRLKEADIEFAVLFYNPNIDTQEEYLLRKAYVMKFSSKLSIPFFDLNYEPKTWKIRIEGLENEPEKGKRCTACFDLRMEKSAFFAHENGFDIFTSSIGISRYKDFEQITYCGKQAALKYPGLQYWDFNWRKKGGLERSERLSREERFYRQKYCGCEYSKV